MKKIFSLLLAFSIYQSVFAQNVGIGTTTPNSSAMLDVSSTTKGMLIPRMTTALKNAIASPATGLLVFDTDLSAFYFYNGSAWVPVSSSGSSDWITSGNNIYNSNTGFVGIGTSSPNTRLHVDGSLRVSTGNLSIDNSIGSLYFRTGNQNRGFFEMRGANYDVTIGTSPLNTTGDFTIQTNATDRIKVLPGGNVGIGVSNPVEKFEVNGAIKTRDGIISMLNTANNKSFYLKNSDLYDGLLFVDNSIVRMNLKSGGNLGIGTVDPIERLDVSGNIRSSNSMIIDNAAAILQLKSNDVNKGFMQLSGDNLRIGTNSGNTNGKIVFRMDNSDIINIQKSGANVAAISVPGANSKLQLGDEVYIDNTTNNMGIGTPSPTERLHVNGNAVVEGGRITGNATGSAYNLLPLAYGRVTANGTKAGGTQNFTAAGRGNVPGYYYVYVTGATASSVMMVTPQNNVSVQATYVNPGVFFVATWYVASNDYDDSPFHFVIYNPQ